MSFKSKRSIRGGKHYPDPLSKKDCIALIVMMAVDRHPSTLNLSRTIFATESYLLQSHAFPRSEQVTSKGPAILAFFGQL